MMKGTRYLIVMGVMMIAVLLSCGKEDSSELNEPDVKNKDGR